MSSNKLSPFSPQNRISWKLVHSNARDVRIVLATLIVWCASNAISSSVSLCFLPFGHIAVNSNTQTDVMSWCHVTFWPRDSNAIFEGKIAQLQQRVRKINSFYRKLKSVWNCVFQTLYFKIIPKLFRFIGSLNNRRIWNKENLDVEYRHE